MHVELLLPARLSETILAASDTDCAIYAVKEACPRGISFAFTLRSWLSPLCPQPEAWLGIYSLSFRIHNVIQQTHSVKSRCEGSHRAIGLSCTRILPISRSRTPMALLRLTMPFYLLCTWAATTDTGSRPLLKRLDKFDDEVGALVSHL